MEIEVLCHVINAKIEMSTQFDAGTKRKTFFSWGDLYVENKMYDGVKV